MRLFATTTRLASALIAAGLLAGPSDPSAAEIDDIISRFAAKEAEFAIARENYLYRQSVSIEELDDEGKPSGKHEVVSDIIFAADGKRSEYVVQGPITTFQRISLDAGDEQDLRNIQPFVLTTGEIPKYQVSYLGREMLETSCYVFSVKPRTLEIGQRYFQGQIWVDEHDLQIVKSYGRGVGRSKRGFDSQYPKFETVRKQVDGKYWFPVSTTANDTLNFQPGPERIRMTVKYENYKQFKSEITITFQDAVDVLPETAQDPAKPAQNPTPPPTPAPILTSIPIPTPEKP